MPQNKDELGFINDDYNIYSWQMHSDSGIDL